VTLTPLAHWIMAAWGWRRVLVAFLAGAVSTLALAPVNLWPAPFLTFPILIWLVDGSAAGRAGGALAAAGAGWWFGFGYFVVGLYWIGNALLVDVKTFGWLLPFAVVALPAGLALFTAFGTALARLMWRRGGSRVLALAVGLTVAEWLRGHMLTGFPWNAFGYALASPLPLAQGAALVGIWGLTFLAVAVYASPAVLADDRADTRRPWVAPALSAALLAGLAIYGAIRLRATPTSYVDGVRLRIMQPNLQQDEKFNYSQKQQVMSRYLALSDRASGPGSTGIQNVTHLIWPESAFPFFLTRDAEALAQIAALLPAGAVLITGAVRAPEGVPDAAITRAYNSIYIIDHDGSILSVYDKVHLVPFGEYLPFQQITKLRGGFIPGDRRHILNVPRAPNVLPLICYEIIFPQAVARGERPGWMVNLTNDAWFGASPGPYQHLQQARIRAIEQGLPLVRAANTGISAVVDPVGRILESLPLGTEGVLDAGLPRSTTLTPYARMGDLPTGLVLAVTVALMMRRRAGRQWAKLARLVTMNSLPLASGMRKFCVAAAASGRAECRSVACYSAKVNSLKTYGEA
jgi:apolipoprotein N-acyltransferase